ncbi:SDR family NAD(P)-dependent oxidoreductase [Novosphingobium resinovorum]|uniref:SDR family NAD(P)-dependent oxidoreductase n=1 Tax=Novosphingobium resinovorum TaxID=158500 RepID=UPI002ED07AEB|nr:SDR family NAD(P)-dependent oxidoreductase [Novosphingobium resinovorum]
MTGILGGEVAVITGCSRGLGLVVARRMAQEGAALVITARDPARLEEIAAGIRSDFAVEVRCVAASFDDAGMAARLREAADVLGGATILVNNAGIFPAALLADADDAMLRDVMTCNFDALFRICREIAPGMAQRGKGSIVNISSIAARTPTPGLSLYAASKGAVEAFSRAIAAELAPAVRVNCVSPGPLLTETAIAMTESDTTGAVDEVDRGIPLQRRGTPEEVTEAVLFLASSRASWTTGEVIQVNGGGVMA